MDERCEAVFDGLQETYTPEEAKREIDAILAKYAPECEIIFGKYTAEIIDSYKVDSQYDRHRICAIISRTGLTARDYENLSAEWMLHNAAWEMHVGRSHAKDVSLDYDRDPRAVVYLATELFDMFDIE